MSKRESRRRRGGGRIPSPLAALLCAALTVGVAWAVLVPPFQAPDEPVHFAYVESLSVLGKLPGGTEGRAISTAEENTVAATNADPVSVALYAKPPWSEADESRWERQQSSRPTDDGGGASSASSYPPAYYVLETLPFLAASGGSALDQLYLARIFSVLWLLVGVVAVWCLAGEIFGRRRALQLAAAATYGLWPMICFITASVNPDAMLYGLSAVTLWLGVLVIRRGLTPGRGLALAAAAGLAAITKAPALALIPGVLLALAWGAARLYPAGRARTVLVAGGAALVLVLPLVAWTLGTEAAGRTSYAQVSEAAGQPFNAREFASYLWQFYLPKLPFQTPLRNLYPVISDYPLYNTWLGTSWGTFGWVNVWFPPWVYRIFLAVSLVVLAGAAVTAVRSVRVRSSDWTWCAVFGFLAVVTLAFVAGTHWSDYGAYRRGEPAFAQGRYLFPVAAVGALFVAAALRAVPARARPAALAAWLGFLVVFQLGSLGLLAARYFA